MIVIWGETNVANKKKIEKVVRSMARLVTGKGKYDPIAYEVTDLGWLFPKALYEYKVLCLAFKLIKCKNVSVFNDYYVSVSSTYNYPTLRSGTLSTNYPYSDNYGYATFHFKSVQLWNKLDKQITNIGSYHKFKKELKNHLLKKQQSELSILT